MRFKYILSGISILVFTFGCSSIAAQAPEALIHKYVDVLSLKKDPHASQYGATIFEIIGLDSATRCEVLDQLYQKRPSQNIYYRIKSMFLVCQATSSILVCPVNHITLEEAKEMLKLAYELEDENLILMGNHALANLNVLLNDVGQTLLHLQLTTEAEKKLNHAFIHEIATNVWLSEILYATRDYRAAINGFQEVIRMNQDTSLPVSEKLHPLNELFLYNTLGLSYQKLHVFDSARMAFHKALELSNAASTPAWRALIGGNIGDILFLEGKYDSAEVLLKTDVRESLADPRFTDNAANSLQWLARIQIIKGNAPLALTMLKEAEGYLHQMPNRQYQSNLYYTYMLAYNDLKNSDSLFAYTTKYLSLHDSLESKAANARAEIVHLRLDNSESIHKIKALNKEKKKITLIRNFSIALALVIGAMGLLFLNRQRLKIKLREQQARDAEAEAQAAKTQLNLFTRHLIEKNNLVEKLQEQLMEKEMTDLQVQSISELSQHTILTDDDWDHFKSLFEKVYPGFFHQLKTKSPDITVAEQRMAALSKLYVGTKEASNMLGISPASVNKTKQRLRARLELDTDADLESYFASV